MKGILGAADQGAEVGAVDQGAEQGATDQGADALATSDATFAHSGQELYHLGAMIHGAVTYKLGAAVHGAEVRVHFLKSFQKGCICEILFKKGQKNKKDGPLGGVKTTLQLV
jgi:hypothetical protein